jgi:hypothetical protein
MKIMPCKTCLKFPVCKRKDQIYCGDIINWIHTPVTINQHPINDFEKFIGKKIYLILNTSLVLVFKKERKINDRNQ